MLFEMDEKESWKSKMEPKRAKIEPTESKIEPQKSKIKPKGSKMEPKWSLWYFRWTKKEPTSPKWSPKDQNGKFQNGAQMVVMVPQMDEKGAQKSKMESKK